MELFTQTDPLRNYLSLARRPGQTIGFIPTMGSLHEGHLELVRRARSSCSHVVVSIFVNPAQFNNNVDLENYPRDLKRDLDLLLKEAVHTIFAPDEHEVYGDNFDAWINPPAIAARLEGQHRPGHFRGVCTVVKLLLDIVEPKFAFFGEKDFQQVRVIEEMVAALKLPVEIARVPTVRESDGLALSSRNALLSPAARKDAVLLSRALISAAERFDAGERDSSVIVAAAREVIERPADIRLDYLEVVDESRLEPVSVVSEPSRLMLAAHLGKVRLIDNLALRSL